VQALNTSTALIQWARPPFQTLLLGKSDIHVWRAALDLSPLRVQGLRQILTSDEQGRAERFCFQKDREHFIVARVLLRSILALYLDIEPGQLRFCYNPYGKPALSTQSGGQDLQFNLSHSHGLALFAVGRHREVGIDIERIVPDLAGEQIAERFFSPGEVARLRALSKELQLAAFFSCWTRKEAYIKARGEGLSLALNQFEVSLAPGEPAALLRIDGNPQEAARWWLQDLNPGFGYAAALAAEGPKGRLKCWQWPEERACGHRGSIDLDADEGHRVLD
jgi:4'-phosphopantetheinyl transferase